MRIEIDKTTAKIANVNIRKEKHGEDEKVACDLKLSFLTGCAFLDQLAAETIEMPYEKLLYDERGNKVALGISAISYSNQYEDHEIMLSQHIAEEENQCFSDVKINKIAVTIESNKSVGVSIRCQFYPEEDQLTWLAERMTHEIELTVVPPKQEDLADQDLLAQNQAEEDDVVATQG